MPDPRTYASKGHEEGKSATDRKLIMPDCNLVERPGKPDLVRADEALLLLCKLPF